MAGSRRARRILSFFLIVIILLVVLAALLPVLLSQGPGRNWLARRLNQRVNGTVRIDALSLNWFGRQSVDGLTILDPAGAEAVNLDITLQAGLFPLLLGSVEQYDIAVSGALSGTIDEHGRFSFADLIVREEEASTTQQSLEEKDEEKVPGEPIRLAGLPALALSVDGLQLTIDWFIPAPDAGAGADDSAEPVPRAHTLVLKDVDGQVNYRPGGTSGLSLESATDAEGMAGTVKLTAEAGGIFDAAGAFTPGGASITASADLDSVPVPLSNPMQRLEQLTLRARSADLAEQVDVEFNASVDPARSDEEAGRLEGSLTVSQPVAADGSINIAPGTLVGSITARNLPSTLLQPFLAGSGIVFTRDVGPQLDELHATFAEGEADGLPRSITVLVSADGLHLELNGQTDPGTQAVTGDHLRFEGAVHPELLAALTRRQIVIDAPASLGMQLDSFTVPGRAKGERFDPDGLAARGSITLREPVGFALQTAEETEQEPHTAHGAIESFSGPVTIAIASSVLSVTGEVQIITDMRDQTFISSLRLRDGEPAAVRVDLRTLAMPLPMKDAPLALSAIGLGATAHVTGPIEIQGKDEGSRLLTMRDLNVEVESASLGERVFARGDAQFDEGSITFEQTIGDLFDTNGRLAPMAATPIGEIKGRDIPGALIAQYIPQADDAVRLALQGDVEFTLTTAPAGDDLKATLLVEGERFDVDLTAVRRPDVLHVASGRVDLTATPELFTALQQSDDPPDAGASEDESPAADGTGEPPPPPPMTLTSPVVMTATLLEPIGLARPSPHEYRLPAEPIRARLTAAPAVLTNVPSIDPDMSLRDLAADVTAQFGEQLVLSLVGGAIVKLADSSRDLGNLTFNLAATIEDGTFRPSGSAELTDLRIRELEKARGAERGAITQWVGESGSLLVTLAREGEQQVLALEPTTPNLAGRFVVEADAQTVAVTGRTTRMTLKREALQSALAAKGEEDEDDQGGAAIVEVAADLPAQLELNRCHLPRAMLDGEAFDPAEVDVDALITGGPLAFLNPDGTRVAVEDMRFTLTGTDLREGLAFALTGAAAHGDQPAAGALEITGRVSDLIDEGSRFDAAKRSLHMTAQIADVPTAVADALGSMNGLLVAAVGAHMNATATANDFSLESGALDFDIKTTNGYLKGQLNGRKGYPRVFKRDPVSGELEITEPLRERLLRRINPILADIRSTEHPLRVTVEKARLPVDGDVSRLDAEMVIDIGPVELDSGSLILRVFEVAQRSIKRTIKAHFPPIKIKIDDGKLSYEEFDLEFDKFTLTFTGGADFNKGKRTIRFTVPIEDVSESIEEVQRLNLTGIDVPFVISGPIDAAPVPAPDLERLPEQLPKIIPGILEDLLRDKLGDK